ncbi:Secreted glycosyl hydrolase [Streptomyces albidoflavus]|uniref:discoidin domain-containing protein n=1 Tax=Streptomyces TaxID=1883 RepID=UPI0005BC48A9|nr:MULTISPECIES: discoidin domain-containing protein [Streptomyces]RZE18144.1 Secreted glycosyl hydrolase [Streptomyces albidoflavus]RZE36616.1 Secreted glycosyl hydrolase [Streptomyces albidoflavus]
MKPARRRPPALSGRLPRPGRRTATALVTASLLLLGLPALPASAAGGPNAAAGAEARAGSAAPRHQAAHATDGDLATYWQGGSGKKSAQWVQTDLGKAQRVREVTLRLPAGWKEREQTIALQGSRDGESFATLKKEATYSFAPGSGNRVTVRFPATLARYVRADFRGNSVAGTGQLAELQVGTAAAATPNLAQGKPFTASSHTDVYPAPNAGDGNRATYWESRNNDLPQWAQVDLGSSVRVDRVVLRLPGGWPSRSQTLKIQGSTDGRSFTDLTASRAYAFDAGNEQSATISFDATSTRYVRVLITANTGQPAGQLAELEVYGPATGDTQAPTAPTGLTLTEPATGQIRLAWRAASDDTGVTGYDVYADGQLRASVAGNVLTWTDTQPGDATVRYTVRARDAAGNVSGDSNAVTREGGSGDTQAPTAPTGLTHTQSGGDIRLSWRAATDNVKVTAYDVYADGQVVKSVGGDVLTWTDTGRPASQTVTYTVRARDAAGNTSPHSNAVTRAGTGGTGADLARGKPITASSTVHTFVAANANDGQTSTYWEGAGGSYPQTLTVKLGAGADVKQVVLKLNPDSAWGTRDQTVQVLGRAQDADGFTSAVAAKSYTFAPSSQNTVTIPVEGRFADVQLRFTANSGAPAGQLAEFEVHGVPAPNPDLKVTKITHSPAEPVESDRLDLTATVTNSGTEAAAATDLAFLLGGEKAGTADVPALAAGASRTVTGSVGSRDAGSYEVGAVVDESGRVTEQDEANNRYTSPDPLVVKPVASSDLVASPVSWSPSSASAGDTLTFSVAVKNQGTTASASGAHPVTLTVTDAKGAVVKTLTGAHNGAIAPGATTAPVRLGTWTAANGKYTVKTVIADDANELPVKRANNTSTEPLFVGRGADMPYTTHEAEDGTVGGGAKVVGPNRTVGDVAGEASGRRAVTLTGNGQYVEFTTKAPTNTLVTRFSIPDNAAGTGTNATLNVYVDGQFLKALDLTSKYAWLYGNEAAPGNSPGSGAPRHIYDEASTLLGRTVPAGSVIRLQKDAANTASSYAIDFVDTEQATALPNPDPAAYTVPAGFSHQDVQDALDRVRMDTSGKLTGVYLPPGDYQTSSKFQVYGKKVDVVGAGGWFTRFHAPASQDNTDVGFRAEASAKGSSFANFAYFGNYTSRIDGPGKVFDFANVSDITIDGIWVEHMVCLYWGANTDRITIKNSRIRNLFADGVNMTNGSTHNHVVNNDARATGDDSFALFSAIDAGGADETDNVYENLTSTLTWRAAGLAVYGGYRNTFRNIHIADTLVYSGITVSSLDFGYPMNGFGTEPTTIENVSLVRTGGHFWGSQTFPGIWLFSASKVFQGIRINNVDIVDPTYSGIMFQTNYVGGQPQFPIKDTVLTDISITGAKKSGDAFDAKSGFGLWANELPEAGQGPAVGEVTINGLTLNGNHQNVKNDTSTFKIDITP